MPVIPALRRLWWADHLRSRVRDQPEQHGETPTLLKIQKISQVWWRMPVIPTTREAEAGESLEESTFVTILIIHLGRIQLVTILSRRMDLILNSASVKSCLRNIVEELASWVQRHVPESQLLGRLRQENHLNPRGGGCSEITTLHASLGNTARLLQKISRAWWACLSPSTREAEAGERLKPKTEVAVSRSRHALQPGGDHERLLEVTRVHKGDGLHHHWLDDRQDPRAPYSVA
ncbi:hypothetical protein AAY473_034325 [Plecturocebus cupreus]